MLARPDSAARLQTLILALDPLEQALTASDEQAYAVLKDEPWSDPASRDARKLASLERDRMDDERRAAKLTVEAAQDVERSAVARLSFRDRMLDKVGVGTEAGRHARDAALETERMQKDVEDLLWKHARRLEGLKAETSAIVVTREWDRTGWNSSSAVQRARRELDGNQLVREAVADPMTKAAALADLGALRGKLLLVRDHEASMAGKTARPDLDRDPEPDWSPGLVPGRR